jgi:hypothetical protein
MNFSQIDDVHLLLSVFTAEDNFTTVQQVVQLAAVDLEERNVQLQVRVLIQ